MKIEPRSKVLFIGDSITDCGRARPIGEGHANKELGDGYVNLVSGLLGATYPAAGFRIINMGVGGNTVRDLRDRWQTDVLDLAPDWLVVFIGINDVWRHFSSPARTERLVSQQEYKDTLKQLVRTIRPNLKGLILMTPYFIEPNRHDPMRMMMDEYGAEVISIAEQEQALWIDTQAAFDVALNAMHPMQLASDRVHPNIIGHMILARAFLQAIDYSWTG